MSLTRKEFELLMALARQAGTVVSRDRLLMEIWQTTWNAGQTLDVHVAALRGKLDHAGLVETVRGVGYRLRPHQPPVRFRRILRSSSRKPARTTIGGAAVVCFPHRVIPPVLELL
ncbi:winged helix-turn-helix domain-containing protein [Micromonospora sp. NPDC007271]|uniref:winged helix-turn-helix domain-containing protein n=1 Tax=Micromonospora sp. NPDC007271 TaxID=3154587 RepID=UPI0033FB0DE5